MRLVLALVVPVAAALLQAAIGGAVAVGGAFPSVPMLAAASWAVAAGAREALWWAFFGGLALDLLSAGPLGAYTVALLPGVLLVGFGERSSAQPIPVLTGVIAVGLATMLSQALYLGILVFLGRPLATPVTLLAETVGVGIYTGALAVAAYPLARLGRRLTEKDSPF